MEFVVSAYVGAKALPGGGNKGNLLKPVNASSSGAAESSIAANKIVAQGINGAKFSAAQITKMLTPSEGDMMLLYRGMTGTEGGQRTLFLATTEEYAASYSSKVSAFKISRSGFKRLVNEGLIETKSGINSANGAKGAEVAIPNQAIKKQMLDNIIKD